MSEPLPPAPAELLQGTLDLLILRSLELGPLHGIGVSDRILQISGGVFHVKPGSLFPALHRLEQSGWIEGAWGESTNRRRAKFYTLTHSGVARLGDEKSNWTRIFQAVNRVLGEA